MSNTDDLTISGTVIDMVMGSPISGANVYAWHAPTDKPINLKRPAAVTDFGGCFSIPYAEGAPPIILWIKAVGYTMQMRKPESVDFFVEMPRLEPMFYNGGMPSQMSTTWVPINGPDNHPQKRIRRFDADGLCWSTTFDGDIEKVDPVRYHSFAAVYMRPNFAKANCCYTDRLWAPQNEYHYLTDVEGFLLTGLGKLELYSKSAGVINYRAIWTK